MGKVLQLFIVVSCIPCAFAQSIEVSSLDDLAKIGNETGYPLDGYYVLTSNIDASPTVGWDAGKGFEPIGHYQWSSFTGEFDGQGHMITNLFINRLDEECIGLFGCITDGGRVSNLGLENCVISGGKTVGGMCGWNLEGTIENVFVSGSISGQEDSIGGLVGSNAGWNNDTQKMTEAFVTGSYSTGSVSSSGSNIGGLVGWNDGTVTACYSTGAVAGIGINVGGLIGRNNALVIGCFWDIDTSNNVGSRGGKGLNTSQMKRVVIFQNARWDMHGWVMNNGEYPRLSWESTGFDPITEPDPIPLTGNGSAENPYRVKTVTDFAILSWYVDLLDSCILLESDLDCSGIEIYPIGDLGCFNGKFDGGNHVIENIHIEQSKSTHVGTFSALGENGSIQNVGVENIIIDGQYFVGGLVGFNKGSIVNCFSTGVVSATYGSVGGLIGNNNWTGDLLGCYSLATVSSDSNGGGDIGGLVGYNQGTLTECYATGPSSGLESIGGLVGTNQGTLTDCYTTGNVSAILGYCGGLLGHNMFGKVIRCYSTGFVSGGYPKGGLIAMNYDAQDVTSSFWDFQTSGLTTSSGGVGLSTSLMMEKYRFTAAGWDFSTTWQIQENITYPFFVWQTNNQEGEGENEGEGEAPDTVTIHGTGRVEDGGRVVLRLTTPPLVGNVTVEWYKDDVLMEGMTALEYVIPIVSMTDAGVYYVIVTDESKTVYQSPPFVLTVLPEGSMPVSGALTVGVLVALLAGLGIRRQRRR